MPTLREPKIMAGLFLVCIPLVIVGSLALYSLKSCTNCSQAQLALLVPTLHPVSTVMFLSLITGSWLLLFGLKSIRIPLPRMKLFITGIGFLSVGAIFLVWSMVTFIAYNPIQCVLCQKWLYESSAIIGGFLGSIGTVLLLMHWKREVLHAHGYI